MKLVEIRKEIGDCFECSWQKDQGCDHPDSPLFKDQHEAGVDHDGFPNFCPLEEAEECED